jgi:glycosyltransferase involved in cell wall biosynthesis
MRSFFSVVTPSFNQASYVEGCIRSVLEQGVDDFEHIIFDGGSTDGSTEIFARYPHVQWTSEPDRGQAHALNKGFARARGDVICWLNTDDQYLPGTFEIVRRELSRPSVDVIYGDAEEVYFDGRPRRRREAKFPSREAMLRWWTKEVDILQPAVFFRRSVLQSVGPLREDLFIAMDLEFWWRVSERFPFHRVDAPLCVQQRQPESKTIKHALSIYEEKRLVFEPLLQAREPNRRLDHTLQRRRGLGRLFQGFAQSAGPAQRGRALGLMARSLAENPLLVVSASWLKALLFLLVAPKPGASGGQP